MLTSSFIHLPGIGLKTEKNIWRQGIPDWDDFLRNHGKLKLSPCRAQAGIRTIKESLRHLEKFNPGYFMAAFPPGEQWRFYRDFSGECAFVDIETDGGMGHESVTVIGVYNGSDYFPFVREENLLDAAEEISRYKLLVTFNGKSFDMPLIYGLFPQLKGRHLHVDVMYPLKKMGYHGGLKKVEISLGLERPENLRGLSGWDAVRLWMEYRNGSDSALETLIGYNREDCVNLKYLVEFAYKELKNRFNSLSSPRCPY